jgi:hypothetical protein
VEFVQFGQGFFILAAPMAELECLVMAGIRCCVGMHPTSRCDRIQPATSSRTKSAPASGSIAFRHSSLYLTKQRPEQKIDAAVAVMMALGRAMTEDDNAGINGFLSNPLII